MIWALVADLCTFTIRYGWRRTRFVGATSSYAGELRAMAAEPGFLSDIEREEQTVAHASIETDLNRLADIEFRTWVGLESIWHRTCKALHLDPIDIEWSLLATGELITT